MMFNTRTKSTQGEDLSKKWCWEATVFSYMVTSNIHTRARVHAVQNTPFLLLLGPNSICRACFFSYLQWNLLLKKLHWEHRFPHAKGIKWTLAHHNQKWPQCLQSLNKRQKQTIKFPEANKRKVPGHWPLHSIWILYKSLGHKNWMGPELAFWSFITHKDSTNPRLKIFGEKNTILYWTCTFPGHHSPNNRV